MWGRGILLEQLVKFHTLVEGGVSSCALSWVLNLMLEMLLCFHLWTSEGGWKAVFQIWELFSQSPI